MKLSLQIEAENEAKIGKVIDLMLIRLSHTDRVMRSIQQHYLFRRGYSANHPAKPVDFAFHGSKPLPLPIALPSEFCLCETTG